VILPVLFDAFFVMVGTVAGWRLVKTVRGGTAIYQGKPFARTESAAAFWSITALNIALLLGSIYGVAISLGL